MDLQEFEAALFNQRPDQRLEELQSQGVLASIFPEVQAMVGFGGGDQGHKDLWAHTKMVVRQSRPSVRWAALFHDVGKVVTFSRDSGKVAFHHHEAVSARLWTQAAKRVGWFPEKQISKIRFVIRHLGQMEAYEPEWTDSAVRRLSQLLGDSWEDLATLARADITTKHAHKRKQHHDRLAELVRRRASIVETDARIPALPKGLGKALMTEMGLEPSEALGSLMKRLEAAVEAGDLPRQADFSVYVQYVRDQTW